MAAISARRTRAASVAEPVFGAEPCALQPAAAAWDSAARTLSVTRSIAWSASSSRSGQGSSSSRRAATKPCAMRSRSAEESLLMQSAPT